MCSLSLLLLFATPTADDSADLNLADYYGFAPVEVYKADSRHYRLVAGDFGGDERTDLAVIDNGGSQIKLWIQTSGDDVKESDGTANAYPLPGRLEDKKILVDREIHALVTGDFNGDGEADFATIEGTDVVQVRLQTEGRFRDQPVIRLADLGTDSNDITAGDFNGDGRDDLAVLGIQATYLLLADGDENDGFTDAVRIPNTSEDLDFAELADLDGDDRLDLFYAAFGDEGYTACMRLQKDGRLGAELRMEEGDLRALALANCDDWPGAEVISIDASTDRVKIQKLQRSKTQTNRRLAQIGLGGSQRADRGWCVADLSGDGAPEVVISDPESAELLLLTSDESGMQPAERFPSLLGIKQIIAQPVEMPAARDLMDRRKSDLLVLSDKEKTVGVVSLRAGKLSLPQPLPMKGTPIAMARSENSVFVLLDGESRGSDYSLVVIGPKEGGEREVSPFEEEQFPADDLGVNALAVSSMHSGDFDGDGLADLLLTGKRKPSLVLFGRVGTQDSPALFENRESNGFALPELDPTQVTISESGNRLLLAQARYGRELVWKDGGWQVARQINAPTSGARVDVLRQFEEGGSAIVDNTSDRMWITDRDGAVDEEVELGDLAVQDVAIADVDGDRRSDLLLLSGGRVGVFASRSDRRELQTLATYEPEDDDAYFGDIVGGDFNNDGLTDIIINETAEHTLEIAAIAAEPLEMLRADRFKLYEQKSFRGGGGGGSEPREMLAVDITGDGLTDLVLLMRDRLLIFPQDGGEEPAIAAE